MCKTGNTAGMNKDRKSSTNVDLEEQIAVLKKKLNSQKNRAKKAEENLESQGQLLATVSHELRTPMGAIINLAELLAESDLSGYQRPYVETLKGSATSLLRILNDVLEHGKLEQGMFELVYDNFSPRQIIDAVIETQTIPCRNKGLALRLEVANDLPDQLFGDALRIRQVLSNLVNNAVKFTSSGTIDISVSISSSGKSHTNLHISVKDTGSGLSESLKDHLFTPYAQGDAQTSAHFGGTGLGLSICRQLVKMMDGEIGYTDNENNGSEFWFHVKCKPYQAKQQVEPVYQQSLGDVLALDNQRTGHILVVEDNKTNQMLISTYLEKFGHTFETVSSGKAALDIIHNQKFDVILMDVKMPEMGGIETTRLIRRCKGDVKSIPIIALTANAMSGDREEYLNAGMDAYVSKPISAAELFHTIDKILMRNQRLAS